MDNIADVTLWKYIIDTKFDRDTHVNEALARHTYALSEEMTQTSKKYNMNQWVLLNSRVYKW